jgi:Ca2+/Na+ antiporter
MKFLRTTVGFLCISAIALVMLVLLFALGTAVSDGSVAVQLMIVILLNACGYLIYVIARFSFKELDNDDAASSAINDQKNIQSTFSDPDYSTLNKNAQQKIYYQSSKDVNAHPFLEKRSKYDRFIEELNAVLSLEVKEIVVGVKGHPDRTLQLRCGFFIPEPKLPTENKELSLILIKREPEIEKEQSEELVYTAELPNRKRCIVVLKHSAELPLIWTAKTFFPIEHVDWFHCVRTEDSAIKDDETLRPIERIEWHRKLMQRVHDAKSQKSDYNH